MEAELHSAAGLICAWCREPLSDERRRYWRRERPDLDTEYFSGVAEWWFCCERPACVPDGDGWVDHTARMRAAPEPEQEES